LFDSRFNVRNLIGVFSKRDNGRIDAGAKHATLIRKSVLRLASNDLLAASESEGKLFAFAQRKKKR
jgi:hypothetical protein